MTKHKAKLVETAYKRNYHSPKDAVADFPNEALHRWEPFYLLDSREAEKPVQGLYNLADSREHKKVNGAKWYVVDKDFDIWRYGSRLHCQALVDEIEMRFVREIMTKGTKAEGL